VVIVTIFNINQEITAYDIRSTEFVSKINYLTPSEMKLVLRGNFQMISKLLPGKHISLCRDDFILIKVGSKALRFNHEYFGTMVAAALKTVLRVNVNFKVES